MRVRAGDAALARARQNGRVSLSNRELSELLALAAEEEAGHRRRAFERAAMSAYTWPVEASQVEAAGRSLTELRSVGPWLARRILAWLEDPPDPVPEPPEIRRGFLTYAEVVATLQENPEWRPALRADLQMHTTYSDGKAPLREMAAACVEYGYQQVLITDHSKGLKIAGGMDEDELAGQAVDIAAANEELAARGEELRVLHGIEMNLDPEGDGDMDPDALARLDLVLGAFHSKLRLTDDQTDRYLAAVRNPTVHVLAHPRGRKFNRRLGLHADWERVFAEAAERGKALEIDGFPDRQDLNVELLELARDAGVWISIGTDAHSVFELRFIEFGLAIAIRAGVPRDRILNYRRVEDVLRWSREVRGL
jgi:histidinol phosphatase-like PHP family hydrolase